MSDEYSENNEEVILPDLVIKKDSHGCYQLKIHSSYLNCLRQLWEENEFPELPIEYGTETIFFDENELIDQYQEVLDRMDPSATYDFDKWLIQIQNRNFNKKKAEDKVDMRLEQRNKEGKNKYLDWLLQLVVKEWNEVDRIRSSGYQDILNDLEFLKRIASQGID